MASMGEQAPRTPVHISLCYRIGEIHRSVTLRYQIRTAVGFSPLFPRESHLFLSYCTFALPIHALRGVFHRPVLVRWTVALEHIDVRRTSTHSHLPPYHPHIDARACTFLHVVCSHSFLLDAWLLTRYLPHARARSPHLACLVISTQEAPARPAAAT
jgi:hypothetical protein